MRVWPPLLALALLAAGLPAVAPPSNTIGVSPAEVRVVDAQKGEEYVRRFVIQNGFDAPTNVTLSSNGTVAAWISPALPANFTIPPMTMRNVTFSLRVPPEAPNGSHYGEVRTVAQPRNGPTGSGFALVTAAIIRLNVSIGGETVRSARVIAVHPEDVELGTFPAGQVRVVNDGNVRSTVRIVAEVLSEDGTRVLLRLERSLELLPGQERAESLGFGQGLPAGNYRLRVRTEGLGEASVRENDFRVVPAGSLGKRGSVAGIEHEAWVEPGNPVRLNVSFTNTGTSTIARAQLVGEVTRDGRLVAPIASPELLVGPGHTVELVAYFTPTQAGEHLLKARVVYDGLETPAVQSLINVQGAAPAATSIPMWLAAALAGGGALILFALLRRRPSG